MSKVLCIEVLPPVLIEMCQKLLADGVSFEAVPTRDKEDFAQLAGDADVLLVGDRRIDAELLALAPRVRLIQRVGSGYENIDMQAARAAGIPVAYTPGANAVAVAEHAIMLMLALVKRLVAAEQGTRAGKWPSLQLAQASISDLAGATIGVVGLGYTGKAVAERLVGFGSRLIYHSRQRADAATEAKYQVTYMPLPELLAAAQIVSLHPPLNAQTKHFMGDEQFSQMRRGSLLVNVSRGGLVDEAALHRAIASGHLAGAGLDTIEQEREGGNPFTDLPQVIVTPHVAASSRGGIDGATHRAFANINRVLAGEVPRDLVPGSS